MRMGARAVFAAVFSMTALSACGGGGASHDAPVIPAIQSGADATTQSVELGAHAATAALPRVAGITGSIVFAPVASPATLTVSASAVAPSGVAPQSVRRTQGDFTLHVYEYITLVPSKTLTFPVLPAMTFGYPASTAIAGASFYYGITDPDAQPGAIVAFQTEGPGKVSGQTVTIGAVARPIVLTAGHHYTFTVYATSIAATTASPKIYVANMLGNSITTYRADGTPTTPVLTGSARPSSTEISRPQSVGVDASGTIHVFDQSPAGYESQLQTFTAGGIYEPPTIELPVPRGADEQLTINGVAFDASGASYAVTSKECIDDCQGAVGALLPFTPNGTPLPTILLPNGGSAVAVGPSGTITVSDGIGITTYRPDGTTTLPKVASINATSIAIDAAGKLYALTAQGLQAFNADGSPVAPTIPMSFVPGAVAVDAAGKIYVTDPADAQVFTYNSDGSSSAPTITTGVDPTGIAVR